MFSQGLLRLLTIGEASAGSVQCPFEMPQTDLPHVGRAEAVES